MVSAFQTDDSNFFFHRSGTTPNNFNETYDSYLAIFLENFVEQRVPPKLTRKDRSFHLL